MSDKNSDNVSGQTKGSDDVIGQTKGPADVSGETKGSDDVSGGREGRVAPCFQLVEVEGVRFPSYYFPRDPHQHVAAMRHMEVRPDDVFICAYHKSGTHWSWEMCSMLVKGRAEYEKNSKINFMMDFIPTEQFSGMPSPRIFNTHHYFRFLPYDIRRKGARVIFLSRNPKDILVSHYHHRRNMQEDMAFKGDWSEFLDIMCSPGTLLGWFDYMLDWERVMLSLPDLHLLHLQYEDLKEDTAGVLGKVSDFLGLGASPALCREIAEACQLSRMKAADKDKQYNFHGFFSPEFRRQAGLYRKGEVGDWKNHFTVAQSERFDRLFSEKMAGSKLTFRYSL